MNRLVLFMASNRLLWLLWLSLGTPFIALSMTLTVLSEIARTLRAMWNYSWKHDLQAYALAFTEKHRKAQRSLGRKPDAGGDWMRS